MNQDELNATVDPIYDAALEPDLWSEALSRVAVLSRTPEGKED
jgi:hypothetical protein